MDDVFRSVAIHEGKNVDPKGPVDSAVAKASIAGMLSAAYDLDIDVDEVFNLQGGKSAELTKEDMMSFLGVKAA